MPKILFVSVSDAEAKEYYSTKAQVPDKIIRVEAVNHSLHITVAAILLKALSGKYETYSPALLILEIVGLFSAMVLVMISVLKFERKLASNKVRQSV